VAGPITVSEVTQSEDCGRHPKMSWEEKLPIPLQQYGGDWLQRPWLRGVL